MDPLRADGACQALRTWNGTADIAAMAAALRTLVPALPEAGAYSADEALAAMRDLGIFLGSLKRHGTEPLSLVPEALPVLTELGRRTGMVPRDTVHHYCTWNPVGERRRMYTGDAQEAHLQDSVRMVFPSLRDGLEKGSSLSETDPLDPKFALLMDELAALLECMVESITMVIDRVSPHWFARELRPYFEEITVGGRVLLGPAAAQVPLWLLDQVVWASDHAEPEYAEFLRESVPYSLPRWRAFYGHWSVVPSVVSRLVQCYGDDPEAAELRHPQLRLSAEALIRMLRVVIVFRGRHLGIARQAYESEVRLYPVGSGGAGVDLLRQILDLTRQTARMSGGAGVPRHDQAHPLPRTCAGARAAQSRATASTPHGSAVPASAPSAVPAPSAPSDQPAPVPALNGKEAPWRS
ncbi:monodechloroaminopyrrolnitrin synthase PrnB family protein [Streptomyces iconiensis]|uniref:DUF1864 family protein n=1 Tax=Streptomyces iconiensis TaxID=1384038 RepID=A0ABT7A885_9ACTN|nr:monodechloroaminopyrrolnitrin synthase PrnB family protein [Streptomyces iconiensis]MDJ1137543.1 DUF1864 family protein [Streptomyces iconiensis]